MRAGCLEHVAPRRVEWRERALTEPQPGELVVQTEFSAISPGTESMIFRGEFPRDIPVDETIPALQGNGWSYPLHYGYALVGRVVRAGSKAEEHWLGRRVFAFHPHQDRVRIGVDECLAVPDAISSRAATFLPNVESAINFVMDAAPLLGERFMVSGQGVVGLLTTALLAAFPLAELATVDPLPGRRRWGLTVGASVVAESVSALVTERADKSGRACKAEDFDAVVELSGNLDALGDALRCTRFDGRIIVGSWYGGPGRSLDLSGAFHRRRLRLISSQVSTLAPQLTGRWDKSRRLALAWDWLERLDPERLITHVLPVTRCQAAFELAATPTSGSLQVILSYE